MSQDYSVNNNVGEVTTVRKQFRTNQMSLLSKATMIAGAGFIIIGVLATLVSMLI
jgi:preprotein translocase subunit Sss1